MTQLPVPDYLPLKINARQRCSEAAVPSETFANAKFSTRWAIDHFSSSGILSTSDIRAASSNSIDMVLADASSFLNSEIIDISRMIQVSLPRNRPVVNQALDCLPALKPGCAITVIVNVAATQEEAVIGDLLNCLASQSMPPDDWEALLYLNMSDRPGCVSATPDHTESRIREFQASHRNLQLHILKAHYSEVQPFGAILHDSACAALARHLRRFPAGPADHLLVMADADQVKASPRWLSTFNRAATRFRDAPAFQGAYMWDRIGLGNDPGVLGYFLCSYALRSYTQALFPENGAEPGGGPNICMRASKFALCGYNPALVQGADFRLAQELRGLGKIFPLGPAARVESSSRRTLIASSLGFSPDEQWSKDETKFAENNDLIRSKIPKALIAEDDFVAQVRKVEFQSRFERWLTGLLNRECCRLQKLCPLDQPKFIIYSPAAVLRDVFVEKLALPVEINFFTKNVTVTNSSNLVEWLVSWRRSIIRPLTTL